MRAGRGPILVTVVAGLLGSVLGVPSAASEPTRHTGTGNAQPEVPTTWLAAGDSFSSGEGLPNRKHPCGYDSPNQNISRDSYPFVARDELERKSSAWSKTEITFTACTGAQAGLQGQGHLPAQLESVAGKKFDLITLTIGGNDAGFVPTLLGCVYPRLRLEPLGGVRVSGRCTQSQEQLNAKIDNIVATLRSTYAQLEDEYLSSGGHIVVLGYPLLLEPPEQWRATHRVTGRCLFVHADDARKLREWGRYLNQQIRGIVSDYETIHYLPVIPGFEGHNLCGERGAKNEWVNSTNALPRYQSIAHPKKAGYAWEGRQLANLLGKLTSRPGRQGTGSRISPVVGTWRHQGDFPTDVRTLTIRPNGKAEYATEGAPTALRGRVEARKGRLVVRLSGEDADGEAVRISLRLKPAPNGRQLTVRGQGGVANTFVKVP